MNDNLPNCLKNDFKKVKRKDGVAMEEYITDGGAVGSVVIIIIIILCILAGLGYILYRISGW